jgi:4'-phosphopantetheinyl transferase EntD
VSAVLAGLFGDAVAAEEVDLLSASIGELLPAEAVLLPKAAAPRLLEFRAGRHCARVALARLGVTGVPVLRAADRTPVWPEGVVGSIAHTRRQDRGWCGAVVARSRDVRSLGLDAELEGPLQENLWERVLSPEERAWLAARPEAERGTIAKLVFSAKESTYKCLYPVARQFLEFHEVRIALVGDAEFRATLLVDAAPFRAGETFMGRHAHRSGIVVTAVTLA